MKGISAYLSKCFWIMDSDRCVKNKQGRNNHQLTIPSLAHTEKNKRPIHIFWQYIQPPNGLYKNLTGFFG
tara:strand:- start:172 stop:381 length:210 start_codon:yes stop_codon:yes gene_type:complete